jgi:hypothetical protein
VYVGIGGVGDVVNWFNVTCTRETILCLLISTSAGDRQVFEALYDHRARISANLDEEIAFFLFGEDQEEPLGRLEPGISTFRMLPGLAKADTISNWKGNSKHTWGPLPAYAADRLERSAVARRTQSIAPDVCEYFDLDAAALPCIIFLTRNNPTPFVVRTRESADMAAIEEFLAELGSFARLLQTSGVLNLPAAVANALQLVNERENAAEQVKRFSEDLELAIPHARRMLDAKGVGGALDALSVDTAADIFEMLGLDRSPNRRPRYSVANPVEVMEAVLDEDVHKALRSVKRAGRQYQKYQNAYTVLTQQLQAAASRTLLNPALLSARLETVEEQLSGICLKYERRFARRHFLLPLKEFARAVTGLAKATKDAVSVVENADKIAGHVLK